MNHQRQANPTRFTPKKSWGQVRKNNFSSMSRRRKRAVLESLHELKSWFSGLGPNFSELGLLRIVRASRQKDAPCPMTPRARGSDLVAGRIMSWLLLLGIAVVIAAVAAVTGIKPKGTRPVSHSRLMGMGRIALLLIVIIFAYLAFRARSGG